MAFGISRRTRTSTPVAFVILLFCGAAVQADPITIMPLGASITSADTRGLDPPPHAAWGAAPWPDPLLAHSSEPARPGPRSRNLGPAGGQRTPPCGAMDRDVSSGRARSAAMTAQGAALRREVKLQNDPSRLAEVAWIVWARRGN